jgi:hypothetical protein
MDVFCPKGHHSTDLDYCSECGSRIDAQSSGISAPAAASLDVCPDCGTNRVNGTALFCEVCRYNFETRQSWSTPNIVPGPAAQPLTATPPPPTPSFQSAPAAPTTMAEIAAWDAILTVDGSLYTEPDPNVPLPADPERIFPLDLAENLIGRRSDRRDIHPEINVNDSGVSHRHAKLLRELDGSMVLLDLGSTNGTRLNGVEVPAGVRTPVTEGDQITLGYWTRISVRARRS